MTIFVEGKADIRFLSDYINKLGFVNISQTDFIEMGGNDETAIFNRKIDFERSTALGKINLLIFDSDGNYETTYSELERIKKKLSINFELFLFPNNAANGALENLLIEIVPEANKVIFKCFDGFEECLKNDARFAPPVLKTRIYAYIDALLSKREKKEREKHAPEENRNYLREDHWNLESKALQPLKTFLESHIG